MSNTEPILAYVEHSGRLSRIALFVKFVMGAIAEFEVALPKRDSFKKAQGDMIEGFQMMLDALVDAPVMDTKAFVEAIHSAFVISEPSRQLVCNLSLVMLCSEMEIFIEHLIDVILTKDPRRLKDLASEKRLSAIELVESKDVFQNPMHIQYAIYPKIFAEIRLQLATVALFLVSCVLSCLIARNTKTIRITFVKTANSLLALLTLFLSLNYVLYMGTLQYGAIAGIEFDSSPVVGNFSPTGGYPMSFYFPSYGFVVFLFSCLILVWLTLRQNGIQKGSDASGA